MLCAPSNCRWLFSYHMCFRVLSVFSWKKNKKLAKTQKIVLNMATSDSQINKPHRGRPKRAELPDVNINTVAQNINTKSASLIYILTRLMIITNSSNLRVTPTPTSPRNPQASSTLVPSLHAPNGKSFLFSFFPWQEWTKLATQAGVCSWCLYVVLL